MLSDWIVDSGSSLRELEWMLFEAVGAFHTESGAEQVWMLGVQGGVSVFDTSADLEGVARRQDCTG